MVFWPYRATSARRKETQASIKSQGWPYGKDMPVANIPSGSSLFARVDVDQGMLPAPPLSSRLGGSDRRRDIMQPILLARAAYLILFIDVLRKLGAPVDRELCRAGLPSGCEEQPDAYIPMLPALRFIGRMERSEGIEDLGAEAAQRVSMALLDGRTAVAIDRAPTLHAALRLACRGSCRESPQLRVWTAAHGHHLRLCSRFAGSWPSSGLRHAQWLQNAVLAMIVGRFAGAGWCPRAMAFEAGFTPGREVSRQFSRTRLLTGRPATWIELSASLLGEPQQRTGPRGQTRPRGAPAVAEPDFPVSLKLALQAYLGEGGPTVDLAAELAGTSVRTLQRRLKHLGASYSGIVGQARFERAARLLEDPAIKVTEVAYAVGYDDAAHFCRAFRRMAGKSPREFRRDRA
ncbi:helix-turn-helix transcriptional regulator [Marinimicrococcus flavescens]|uniref:Helix-turn-helix domain-containing protein n=1 Tax=Marinimicrococcus flavescens TaxID=3031815 RepID=A0AAP3XSB5_9PROT|nr:helix-turn-helix domain-containing protein [Marinimicrococcus flavescens]